MSRERCTSLIIILWGKASFDNSVDSQAALAVAAVAAGVFIYKAVRDEDTDVERHGRNAKGDAKGAYNDAKGNAKGAWKEAKGNVKGAFNS